MSLKLVGDLWCGNMVDSVSDFLVRIRNAQCANKGAVVVFSSRVNIMILEVLRSEGYIDSFGEVRIGKVNMLLVKLKYHGFSFVIRMVKRVSKPGRRVYVKWNAIPKVLNGLGTLIISTSKGVMTGTQARKMRVGGEVLCTVF